jgi:acetoacetyl-CoA synthetase
MRTGGARLTLDRVEAAVKQILSGMKVKISASVANADCLEWYRGWAASH